jgi:hypothetical protein
VRLRIAASQVSSCCATSGQSPWRARVPPGSQPLHKPTSQTFYLLPIGRPGSNWQLF